MVEPEHFIAELPHLFHRVGYKDSGNTGIKDLPHLSSALFTEGAVADGKHFIKDDDVRRYQAGDGKCQPALHSAGKLFERTVLEVFELRKLNDGIILSVHEVSCISQHRTAKIGIFLDGKITVKSAAEFQQRRDVSVYFHVPFGRNHDAGDRF